MCLFIQRQYEDRAMINLTRFFYAKPKNKVSHGEAKDLLQVLNKLNGNLKVEWDIKILYLDLPTDLFIK